MIFALLLFSRSDLVKWIPRADWIAYHSGRFPSVSPYGHIYSTKRSRSGIKHIKIQQVDLRLPVQYSGEVFQICIIYLHIDTLKENIADRSAIFTKLTVFNLHQYDSCTRGLNSHSSNWCAILHYWTTLKGNSRMMRVKSKWISLNLGVEIWILLVTH